MESRQPQKAKDLSRIDLSKLDYFTVGVRKYMETDSHVYFLATPDSPLVFPDAQGGNHNWFSKTENQDEFYLGFPGGYAFLCIFEDFKGWLVLIRDNPSAPTYKNHANFCTGYPNVPAKLNADPLGEINFKNSVNKREGLQELCIFDTQKGMAIAPSLLISDDFGHDEFEAAFDEMRDMASKASGIKIPQEYIGVRSKEIPIPGEKTCVLSWELDMSMKQKKAFIVDERKYGRNNVNLMKACALYLPGKRERYIIIDAELLTLSGQPCDSAIAFIEADDNFLPKKPYRYSYMHKSGKPYTPDPQSELGKTLDKPLLCPLVESIFQALENGQK